MKKILALSLFISLLLACIDIAKAQTAPRFETYAASVYKGKSAPVNLKSAKGASAFRTRLREGARAGVNFAGHFALVGWGCGTGCVDAALIDERNGQIYFPKELASFDVLFWSDTDEPLMFKANSRMLILSGFPATEADSDNPKTGLYYYEWTGTRLKLIKSIPKNREDAR